MSPRNLIIGLDGATFDVIDPLVAAGVMPVLASIMERGVRGRMLAWPNMNSAASWSSMITGYNPGQHGVFDFGAYWESPTPAPEARHPTTGADRKKDPFWRILSVAGKRVGVINVPISYPADQINGFMLAGMDTPSVRSPGFAHPPDLLAELHRHGIDYILDVSNPGAQRARAPYKLPDDVKRLVEARSRTVLYMMQQHPCDVLMAVFVATDRMQHGYFPDLKSDVDSPNWTPIRDLYRQIDLFLGKAVALCGEDTTIMLVSDHGFGPARNASRSLNALFARLGLLAYRSAQRDARNVLLSGLLEQGRRYIPSRFQFGLAHMFPVMHMRAVSARKFVRIDWPRTQVFAHGLGCVSINLRGREPEGTVSPDDYDAVCERVRDVLLRLVNPGSSQRPVRAVHRRDEVYHGPFLSKASDLLIEWDYSTIGDSLSLVDGADEISISGASADERRRSGKGGHHPEGIFIACGPDIRKGGSVTNVRVYDIAPTVLYLQDQPVLTDMDGKVLSDIFEDEYVRQHPVRTAAPEASAASTDAPGLDAEDEKIIEQRLRDLGYIE